MRSTVHTVQLQTFFFSVELGEEVDEQSDLWAKGKEGAKGRVWVRKTRSYRETPVVTHNPAVHRTALKTCSTWERPDKHLVFNICGRLIFNPLLCNFGETLQGVQPRLASKSGCSSFHLFWKSRPGGIRQMWPSRDVKDVLNPFNTPTLQHKHCSRYETRRKSELRG